MVVLIEDIGMMNAVVIPVAIMVMRPGIVMIVGQGSPESSPTEH